jgi:hypothetical protein
MKFHGGVNKRILRAFMKRHLPAEIITKPKSGFVVDLNRVLDNPLRPWAADEARAGRLQLMPAWRPAAIDELLQQHRRAPADTRFQQRLYALCLLNAVWRTGTRPPGRVN